MVQIQVRVGSPSVDWIQTQSGVGSHAVTLTQMHGSFSAIAENLVCCVIMAKQPEHTNLIKDIKKLVIERHSVILPRTSAILLSEFLPIMSTDPRCTQLS